MLSKPAVTATGHNGNCLVELRGLGPLTPTLPVQLAEAQPDWDDIRWVPRTFSSWMASWLGLPIWAVWITIN